MVYLVAGITILVLSFGLLRLSLPGRDGKARAAVVRGGMDTYIAIAVTLGVALGFVALIYGGIEIGRQR